METGVRFELDGGCDAPDSKKEGLVQAALAVIDGEFLDFLVREILRWMDLTMGKNHRIDSLAAADAMPVDRPDFEYFLRNHDSTATMAAVGSPLLWGDK
jgi:hypothetical protein